MESIFGSELAFMEIVEDLNFFGSLHTPFQNFRAFPGKNHMGSRNDTFYLYSGGGVQMIYILVTVCKKNI